MELAIVLGAGIFSAVALSGGSSGVTGEKTINQKYKKLSTARAARDQAQQINDDIDIGIRTNQNVASANAIYTEEVGGIIRSDSYHDIYNVRNNALDFQNQARIKNKALGESQFNPDNRDIILIPSFGVKQTPTTVPNPAVLPGYRQIPNAWVDRISPKVTCDNVAANYKEPYGANISPFNMPQAIIQMDSKFGNPWGPAGEYNAVMREGGQRLSNTYDFNPKKYTKKQVSFAPSSIPY